MTEKKKSGFEALATKTSLYPEEKLMKVKKGKHSFFIGLPKEISLQENRISLTPDAVALLVNNGHEVWVEAKAGIGSKFTDKQYSEAGAKIALPRAAPTAGTVSCASPWLYGHGPAFAAGSSMPQRSGRATQKPPSG